LRKLNGVHALLRKIDPPTKKHEWGILQMLRHFVSAP
jgi:hypothetical protein